MMDKTLLNMIKGGMDSLTDAWLAESRVLQSMDGPNDETVLTGLVDALASVEKTIRVKFHQLALAGSRDWVLEHLPPETRETVLQLAAPVDIGPKLT